MNNLRLRVFTKEETGHSDVPAEVVNDHLNAEVNRFVSGLSEVLRQRKIRSSVTFHKWPKPVTDELIIRHENEGHYEYLRGPDYDADIAVCAVPSADKIDAAVGELWLRQRKLLHLCVMTMTHLPDYQEEPDLYKGLLALPTAVQKRKDAVLFEPVTQKSPDGSIFIPNPVTSRYMTIDSFRKMNGEKVHTIADLVTFQLGS